MKALSLARRVGPTVALAVALSATQANAQFVDFADFGSTSGKLNDLDGSIANVTAFNGNPFTVAYSPDSIDFGGSLAVSDNSGVFLSLDPANTIALSGVQDDTQRLQVDVTIGPSNEADDLTVQLTDTLFGSGYAYQFDISSLGAGTHTLFSPVLNAGTVVGTPFDFDNDVIDQITFFGGNFVSGAPQAVDISVDSLSLFTPTPVDPGVVAFGPVPNEKSYANGGLFGFDTRSAGELDPPSDNPNGGLRYTGTVSANSLSGSGVNLTEPVDISPASNPLSGTDELVLEIEVGANNEVRDIIFEIIDTSGPGGGDIAQKSWFLSGIQDLAPGRHVIVGPTFDEGTNGTSVFPFDPAEGDLVEKVVLFGFNFQNADEPNFEDVTDKQLDITLLSVSFGVELGALPGDFNNDGMVNAADYTVWRDNFNQPEDVLFGNGDGSGTVDQGDYTVWVNNFGSTAAQANAVPEPMSAIGLAAVAMGAFARRRRS